MNKALEILPGKASGTRKKRSIGGNEVDEFGIPIQ
jgi:hypothetical protein